MILHSLYLLNYKQYKEAEIDFKQGLMSITGKNGAGKSTIFEAILYALYGNEKGEKSLIPYQYKNDKENVKVALTFEYKQQLYRAERELKGKNLSPSARLIALPHQIVAEGIGQTLEAVQRLLGMELKAFRATVYSEQKQLDEITNMGGTDRKRMIRKFLGLDILDEISQFIRKDANEANSQVDGMLNLILDDLKVKDMEAKLIEFDAEIQKITAKINLEKLEADKIEKEYQSILEKVKEMDEILKKYNNFTTQLAKYNVGLDYIIKNIESNEKDLNTSQNQLQETEQKLNNFKDFPSKIQQFELLEKDKHKLELKKSHEAILNEKKLEIERLELEIKQKRTEIDLLSNNISQYEQLKANLGGLKKKEEIAKKKIDELGREWSINSSKRKEIIENLEKLKKQGDNADCPTCYRPLKDTFDNTLKLLESLIADYTKKIADIDIEQTNAKNELAAFSKQRNDLEADINLLEKEQIRLKTISDSIETQKKQIKFLSSQLEDYQKKIAELGVISFDKEKHTKLNQYILENKNIYENLIQSHRTLLTNIPNIKLKIAEQRARIPNAKKSIEQIEQSIKQLNFNSDKYELTKKEQTNLVEVRQNIYYKLNESKRNLDKIISDKNIIISDLEKNKSNKHKIELKKQEKEQLDLLGTLIDKFKILILEKIAPSISDYSSKMFSSITKGRYPNIEIDENFDFYIIDGKERFPIKRFSGGEVDLANLCLRIALSKAITDLRGAAKLNFLAFDEIFGSQDEVRRLDIMRMLNQLQDQFAQIFIISHIDSIKDLFPHTLQISRKNNESVASWLY